MKRNDSLFETRILTLKGMESGDVFEGFVVGEKDTQSAPPMKFSFRLVHEKFLSPDELISQLEGAQTVNEFVFLAGLHLTGPDIDWFYEKYQYELEYTRFVDPSEVEVEVMYHDFTPAEGNEALLFINEGDFRSMVFMMQKVNGEWKAGDQFLHFGGDRDATSCLYCMDDSLPYYFNPRLIPLNDGSVILEGVECGGRCTDGADRGDWVARHLVRIDSNGFSPIQYIFEHIYSYASPCPDAIEIPDHIDFRYFNTTGQGLPNAIELIHYEYELIPPPEGEDCLGGNNTKLTRKRREVIQICE